MAVAVITSPGMGPGPVAAWGARFAAARGLELDIVLASTRSTGELPTMEFAVEAGAAATFYVTGIRASRASGRRPVWVRRTLLGLVLCALVLIVPLGSVLITKVAQQVVEDPSARRSYRVSDEVYAAMEEGCAALGEGHRLEGITASRLGDLRILELDLISSSIPGPPLARKLELRASEISGKPIRVRLLVRQLVESAPTKQHGRPTP